MRKDTSERGNKISVAKIKKDLSPSHIFSEDFALTPMMNLQMLEGKKHTFDGLAVGVICNGTAKVTIDGKHFEMRRNTLLLLRDSSVAEGFKCSKACMGYFIAYPTSFINAANISMADLLTIKIMFGNSPCLQVTDDEIARLHSIVTTLSCANSVAPNAYDKKVQISLFESFFYMLASILSKYASSELDDRERLSRTDDIMRSFTQLIDESCERERSVEYYASQLGITPKYLSLVCKKKVGYNASKLIDAAVIRRAKSLLQQQGMSVLEVSERLNFVSQSFFGKYFKQRTGISPSRYKSQH